MGPKRHSVSEYVSGIKRGEKRFIAQAITLIESQRESDLQLGEAVLQQILPLTGHGTRVGITGSPGVGKSTFLDSLGMLLIQQGLKVAVLAVDPSSTVRGGSILGDKTRMSRLAVEKNAFIRPSPSRGLLGGVARKTRESLLICEAAGFDVIFVETVGVGQSEVAVSDLVDCMIALLLPGGGDDLQGIKKGLLEVADIVAVNKADGDNIPRAKSALSDYRTALHCMPARIESWQPKAQLVSGLTGDGIGELWAQVISHRQILLDTGGLDSLRASQRRKWMWSMVQEGVSRKLKNLRKENDSLLSIESELDRSQMTAAMAAKHILKQLGL